MKTLQKLQIPTENTGETDETSTAHKGPSSNGLIRGRDGSADRSKNMLAAPAPTALTTLREIDLAVERLAVLAPSPKETTRHIDEIKQLLDKLDVPADPEWIALRITTLLHSYFEKDAPDAVHELTAEDWFAEIDQYPEWAITRAVRWWIGPKNKNRGRHPVVGDIAARCEIETIPIRTARFFLVEENREPWYPGKRFVGTML